MGEGGVLLFSLKGNEETLAVNVAKYGLLKSDLHSVLFLILVSASGNF